MGEGRDFGEDFALVVLDREQASAANGHRARRPSPSRWPLRWSWIFIVGASLALWTGIIALARAVF
jgi:hypothetical protein